MKDKVFSRINIWHGKKFSNNTEDNNSDFRTFVTDTQSKRPVRFHDLEHAIEYTREMGKAFENIGVVTI